MKTNCWEAKKCGRQPGGEKSNELGICPATTEKNVHGVNSGINGGRSCWAIQKTLCGNQVQGTFAQKLGGCMQCDFYAAVRREEGGSYVSTQKILGRLN